jgi:AraC-like DNA-binding protein
VSRSLEAAPEAADSSTHLRSARSIMDASYHLPLDVDTIAGCAGFSRYYFIRAFRRAFGITPHQYLIQRRIDRAQALLAHSELTITEICFAVGFQSLGSFSALFHRQTGQSPSAYRTRAQEQHSRLYRSAPNCFLIMYGVSQ